MNPTLKTTRLNQVQPLDVEAVSNGVGIPLWRGMLHALVGEGESGKTWLAANSAHLAAEHGAGVLVIDGEMSAPSWKRRMQWLGELGDQLDLVAYAEMADHAADPNMIVETCTQLAANGWPTVELIIWDSALSLLSRTARSENDNAEVSRVYDRIREIIRRTNAAGLIVDHVTRGSGSLVSRGATAKFNALDVSYGVRLAEGSVPSREETWTSIVSVEKDRHGLLPNRADREVTFIPLGHGALQIDIVESATGTHRLSAANPIAVMVERLGQLDPPPVSGNDAHRRLGGNRRIALAAFKQFQENGAGTPGTTLTGGYRVPVIGTTGTSTGTPQLVPLAGGAS